MRVSAASRAGAAFELAEQALQAGLELVGAVEHGLGRFGVEAEQAVDAGGQRLGFSLAGLGHLLHQLHGLQQAGEGEGAVLHSWRVFHSRGASVVAITAPPRHSSPRYRTRDCPGVTARCATAKATERRPSPSSRTSQSWSCWR